MLLLCGGGGRAGECRVLVLHRDTVLVSYFVVFVVCFVALRTIFYGMRNHQTASTK